MAKLRVAFFWLAKKYSSKTLDFLDFFWIYWHFFIFLDVLTILDIFFYDKKMGSFDFFFCIFVFFVFFIFYFKVYFFYFFYWVIFVLFLWITTKVTTKSYQGKPKWPKMGPNSIIRSFFAKREKKDHAECRSPPKKLEVGPYSKPFLLVNTYFRWN